MQKIVIRLVAIIVLLATACRADDPAHARRNADDTSANVPPTRTSTPVELSADERVVLQARIQALADSVDGTLRRVPNLTRAEKQLLLRDVNAVQIARARKLGVPRGAAVEPLAASGKLVKLADTTAFWIVRDLKYSVPYVTPAAEAMLADLSQRFHERLDSLGLPRYRLDITSVMRTPEKQSALRKANSNASRVESAHEFGTTVDIAYRRYAPPISDSILGVPLDAETRLWGDSLLVDTGRKRAAEMQAILGRVLREMQSEGLLMVRMEKRQTVYHITVARHLPKRPVSAI